jgi:hypothetical protein
MNTIPVKLDAHISAFSDETLLSLSDYGYTMTRSPRLTRFLSSVSELFSNTSFFESHLTLAFSQFSKLLRQKTGNTPSHKSETVDLNAFPITQWPRIPPIIARDYIVTDNPWQLMALQAREITILVFQRDLVTINLHPNLLAFPYESWHLLTLDEIITFIDLFCSLADFAPSFQGAAITSYEHIHQIATDILSIGYGIPIHPPTRVSTMLPELRIKGSPQYSRPISSCIQWITNFIPLLNYCELFSLVKSNSFTTCVLTRTPRRWQILDWTFPHQKLYNREEFYIYLELDYQIVPPTFIHSDSLFENPFRPENCPSLTDIIQRISRLPSELQSLIYSYVIPLGIPNCNRHPEETIIVPSPGTAFPLIWNAKPPSSAHPFINARILLVCADDYKTKYFTQEVQQIERPHRPFSYNLEIAHPIHLSTDTFPRLAKERCSKPPAGPTASESPNDNLKRSFAYTEEIPDKCTASRHFIQAFED